MKPEDAIKHGEEAAFRDYIERQAKALGLLGRVVDNQLTRRECFASEAVAAILSRGDRDNFTSVVDGIEVADMLIRELAKEPQP